MSNRELDIFYAGVIEVRALVYMCKERRPYLEVMNRDRGVAEAMMEHFGAGKVTAEHPRHNPEKTNYVWRVQGRAVLDVIRRVRPYLMGYCAEACDSVLARSTPRNTSQPDRCPLKTRRYRTGAERKNHDKWKEHTHEYRASRVSVEDTGERPLHRREGHRTGDQGNVVWGLEVLNARVRETNGELEKVNETLGEIRDALKSIALNTQFLS